MFSPQEQQVEICLLKSNLEEIENDLLIQCAALPALDAENEQRYREAKAALQVARSLSTEIERLKLDNVRLSAKRMQLKREHDDIDEAVKKARRARDELTELLNKVKQDTELQIRNYEETMQEIADRFRKTRRYYNQDEMNAELEKVNTTATELEDELGKRQCGVDELKRHLDSLQPKVPEDILTIIGKLDLDEKIKELSIKHDALTEKVNILKLQFNQTPKE